MPSKSQPSVSSKGAKRFSDGGLEASLASMRALIPPPNKAARAGAGPLRALPSSVRSLREEEGDVEAPKLKQKVEAIAPSGTRGFERRSEGELFQAAAARDGAGAPPAAGPGAVQRSGASRSMCLPLDSTLRLPSPSSIVVTTQRQC